MASSAGKNIMEIKPSQDQINQQQALKCPRCDSSNTKFCYYNNYSLSQPRHFCKACKRYWTRGGTLRNVPVGGGCRKNKRVRRAASAAINVALSSSSTPVTVTTSSYSTVQPPVEASSTSNHLSPLFFGINNTSTGHSELALPYPRFSSRVLSGDAVSGYDLVHPQLNALGLRFSSGIMASNLDHDNVGEDYGNGFRPNKQTHDAVCNSNSLFSSYSMFGSSTSPTMASLLASSFHQQKYQGMVPYEDNLQVQVKMEGQNRLDSSIVSYQNQIEQINPSDPSLYWNSNWLDPSIIGSSVPSLI